MTRSISGYLYTARRLVALADTAPTAHARSTYLRSAERAIARAEALAHQGERNDGTHR